MKISDLTEIGGAAISLAAGSGEIVVVSVEYDSRKVNSGSLFVAVEGFESDGHDYIENAVKNGCTSLLVSESRGNEFMHLAVEGVTVLVSGDTRRALSLVSSIFYGNPSASLHVTGVTGTNGKTSITYLLESVFEQNGISCGVMGTVNYRWNGKSFPAPNTTPESRDIQEMLRLMLDEGVTHVIMEVSSHALELNRVDDVEFDSAVFTNLTGDHLDFHKTFVAYFAAKKRLFELLDKSPKAVKTGVINIDDEYGRRIVSDSGNLSYPVRTFSSEKSADIYADSGSIDDRITGVSYTLQFAGRGYPVSLKLAGRFQVQNSLAAFGAAVFSGLAAENVVDGLCRLSAVPGRLHVIGSRLGFHAVVDYAHTGDALLKLLQSVNEMPHRSIVTVFGCGGDRDRTKRPVMGRIASEYSDFTIVTSDNPRSEDPSAIIDDIKEGLGGADYIAEPDRETAISEAVRRASAGDIIVIAGKGHEDYQIIGKTKRHFDDCEMALKYMSERERVEGVI